MTPERWLQVRQILDSAENLGSSELGPFLDRHCGDDRELRDEVESLLGLEAELEGFADRPAYLQVLTEPTEAVGGAGGGAGAGANAAEVDRATRSGPATEGAEQVGRKVGPFLLVELLGRGGMGEVYLAERTSDFEQRVALKLVQTRWVNPALVRRFHAERQILARLEHPNIARLLDGGTTRGLPWFAMELVDGRPIDQWADQRGLDPKARLELFLHVCSALQWAHRNLVIHRDLKPGNILVDAEGTPKLLDFGIAQLLDPERPEAHPPAETGPAPMTLAYASPEQLLGEPLGTTSDIYSLGVVLYRLLARGNPYSPSDATPFEALRTICEAEPPPPSEALVLDGIDADPRAWRKALRGDLDAIVAKALRKEPEARYATVDQLAEDLRRHLEGLPVSAHPPTVLYRWGKLVRRYRWRFAAAAALCAIVLGFTLALAGQLRETRRERDKATTISAFLVRLFEGADPDRRSDDPPTVLELVDQGRHDLDDGLEGAPEARTELQRTLGVVYGKLGRYQAARELLEQAVEALRREHRHDHPDLARALNDLATVDNWLGDLDAATELYRESIEMRRRLGLDDELPKPLSNFASILLARGELREAEAIYRDILAHRRREMGPDHPNVASSLRSLATVLYSQGRLDEAEPLLRQALVIRTAAFGDGSPRVATVLGSLGRLALARGQLEEAEAFFSRSLAIRRERLGDEHLHTAIAQRDLAALLVERGEVDTARVLIARALEVLYRVRGHDDVYVAEAEAVLGQVWAEHGRIEEARACLVDALEVIVAQRGPHALRAVHVRGRLETLDRGASAEIGEPVESGGGGGRGMGEGAG